MHGYADFLSVGIRVSYRWVPRNRVGAFILRSEFHPPIGRWWFMRVKVANYRVSHLAIVPALTNITSEQVFLFSYPLTTCSIFWSALRGLEKLHMESTLVFRDRGLSNLYQNDQKLSGQLLPLLLHNARGV